MLLQQYALDCLHNGLSVVPPREDGSKAPLAQWKKYQTALPSAADVTQWYGDRSGIGFVTGSVSGNLEVLDFDSSAHFPQFCEWLEGYSGKALVDKITINGCVEASPKGVHVFYRCSTIGKNAKLANDAAGNVLIETRAEGGYIVAAPTNGKVNPNGKYTFMHNNHLSIPTVTPDEREDIITVASFFDCERAEKVKPYSGMPKEPKKPTGAILRPGDDYNERGDWQELLEGAGWSAIFERGDCIYLVKPGSTSRTHHATLNHEGSNLFYCFSSSAHPFDPDTSYSKFAVFTLLNHGGDFEEAALDLAGKGYGTPLAPSSEVIPWQREAKPEDDQLTRRWTGASLMSTSFAPLQFLSRPFLPASAAIVLAGSPKVGKSFLVLDLCLCCDSDGKRKLFNYFPVESCGVLYLALEDTPESIRDRLETLAKPTLQFSRHVEPSEKMHIYFQWPRLGAGCLERIEAHLDAHPDTRLIIVDTLQLVRPSSRKGVNAYETDYEIIASFRRLAGARKVCILLLTHLRKGDGTNPDPFEEVTGSMGISGAADATIILKRKAGENKGKLYTRGRRVEDQAMQLAFSDCVWSYVSEGDYGQIQHAAEVIECLQEHGTWMTAADVSHWLYRECGIKLSNPRQTMIQLVDKEVCAKEGRKYNLYSKRFK